MVEDLRGRVAVITGASRGIGAAVAEALAQEGCHLVLAARSADRLEALAQRLGQEHGIRAVAVPTDMADEAQVRALIRRAAETFGTVDILVNNAGLGLFGAVHELHMADLRDVFEVNFFGPVAAMQEVVPLMQRQGRGSIVNIASIVGRFPQPLGGGYSATKYALIGISGAARAELKRDGIRVILVCPGLTDTEFARHSRVSVPGLEAREGEAQAPFPGVSPERVARRTVEAIRRGEREVYVTFFDRLVVWFAWLFPGIFEALLVVAAGYRRDRFRRRRGLHQTAARAALDGPLLAVALTGLAGWLGWRLFRRRVGSPIQRPR